MPSRTRCWACGSCETAPGSSGDLGRPLSSRHWPDRAGLVADFQPFSAIECRPESATGFDRVDLSLYHRLAVGAHAVAELCTSLSSHILLDLTPISAIVSDSLAPRADR